MEEAHVLCSTCDQAMAVSFAWRLCACSLVTGLVALAPLMPLIVFHSRHEVRGHVCSVLWDGDTKHTEARELVNSVKVSAVTGSELLPPSDMGGKFIIMNTTPVRQIRMAA